MGYDHAGREVNLAELITEEYVIPSKKIGQTAFQQEAFAMKGVWGSFIIDTEGKVCGLLYGAATGNGTDITTRLG